MSAPFMSPSGNVRTFPWFLWESEVLTSLWWDAESSFSARGRRRLVKSWAADTCPSSWWIVSCRDGIQPAATAAAGWTICHDPTSVYLKIPSPIPWFVWSSFSWTYYASCSPVSLLLRPQRSASQGGFTPIVCVLGSESDDESMDSVRLSSSGICCVFQNGPAEIACPHDCGDCLGNIMGQSGSFETLQCNISGTMSGFRSCREDVLPSGVSSNTLLFHWILFVLPYFPTFPLNRTVAVSHEVQPPANYGYTPVVPDTIQGL